MLAKGEDCFAALAMTRGGVGLWVASSPAVPRNDGRGRGLSCPLRATFLTRDFYTRLAPIEGAPQALAGRAMSVSGTPESGLAREVASEKNNKL